MRTCPTVAVLVVLLAVPATPAMAQGGGHDHSSPAGSPATPATSRSAPVPLRLAIDGKLTPALISDDLAYRHFVLIAAERTTERLDASAQRRARRQARVARIGLSPKDTASLTSALTSVRERLDAIRAARETLPADPSRERVAALRTREQAVLDGAVARLKAFLTPAGRARLEGYVRREVKPHVVVFTD